MDNFLALPRPVKLLPERVPQVVLSPQVTFLCRLRLHVSSSSRPCPRGSSRGRAGSGLRPTPRTFLP
jgi:hypothetical protein